MNTITDKARDIVKWYVSLIVCIVFSLNAAVYFDAIEGLNKPAGLNEALQFLIDSPGEYFACLFCGAIAKISVFVMLIVAVASLICLVDALFISSRYYDARSRNQELVLGIVNWILLIIMSNLQTKIIVNFWILVGLIVVIFFVALALLYDK